MQQPRRLEILFHPRGKGASFTVEKEEGGRKRRYFEGVTSGIALDGHGERMTERAIKSFMQQANSGNILLFMGKHDVTYHDDMGKLVACSVDDSSDWHTSYRLYDEGDGFTAQTHPHTFEVIDKTWKQANGIQPYDFPKPFGFSVEGEIPEEGIQYMDSMGRRVIDDVKLSGVVLVPSPAYRTSVARCVMKALGLPEAHEIRKALLGTLEGSLAKREAERDYFDEKYQLQDALEDMVGQIMDSPEPDKADRLKDVFGQFTDLMIGCIINHPEVFRESGESPGDAAPSQVYEAESGAQERLQRLIAYHGALQKISARLKEGDGNAKRKTGDVADAPHGDIQ